MAYQPLPLDSTMEPDSISEFTDQNTSRMPAFNPIADEDPMSSKAMDFDIDSKWKDFNSTRRSEKNKIDSHRKGPAPIDEAEGVKKSVAKATYGTLDSDVEELEFDDVNTGEKDPYNKVKLKTNSKGDSLASCRALIIYFSKLAKSKDDNETIDLNFVDSLLQSGADINFADKHGQTVMHEISRGWHTDVARFAIQHGANVNKADCKGRTPLHLAGAVDYDDMVEFLVHNGGIILFSLFITWPQL